MRQIAAILLVLVNLISSGFVDFAINSCCDNEIANCCTPKEYSIDKGCCCTETESHFYYYTAKFQNNLNSKNDITASINDCKSVYSILVEDSIDNLNDCSAKVTYLHRFRKKAPPELNLMYDVWII